MFELTTAGRREWSLHPGRPEQPHTYPDTSGRSETKNGMHTLTPHKWGQEVCSSVPKKTMQKDIKNTHLFLKKRSRIWDRI